MNADAQDVDARVDLGYFENTRPEVRALVPPGVEEALEIGCATGAMAEVLVRDDGVKAIDGIEIEPWAAEQARSRMRHVMVGDVIEELTRLERSYDLVLAADVLEHLVDPWQALRLIHARLRPGGLIIGSLPNIGSVRVLGPLVFRARFDYVDTGILDRTHLRFFTKSSIVSALEDAGFVVDEVTPRVMGSSRRKGLARMIRPLGRFVTDQYVFRAIRLPTQ